MAVVLEERINKKRASYLLDTYTFDQFYSAWEGSKTDAKKEYTKLIKYLESKVKDENDYVKYNYTKGRTNGRLFGDNTIQSCKRNIRGFLCEGITTDIDLVNCHPNLLMKVCEEHDIECSNLKQYCNERKSILKRIMEDDNISYEHAKKKVLVATNSNKNVKSNNPFFNNYDKEMSKIQKKLMDVPNYAYLKDIANKDTNFEGSFINHVLCVYENQILTLMRQWCTINNIEVHSLMFDGLMVYGHLNISTLLDIEKYIHQNSMFDNSKLDFKQHEHSFQIPDDYIENVRLSYKELKKEFEQTNAKVGCQFIYENHDEVEIIKKGDYTTLHEELIFYQDSKSQEFISAWLKDPNKRRYDKIDSYPKPSLCPSYVYNMWKPFPVEKYPSLELDKYIEKSLNWFLNHIKVLVDYDETCYKFVCMWISQMFQYPEHKSVELFFISSEGAGKGCFLEFFKTIMGGSKRCWETTNPEEEVFGKFNGGMKDAFLVVFNEVNKSNFYNKNDSKKAIITDDNININIKGVPQFNMKSYHRFLSFSNNPDPALKNKRRDVFFRSSDDKVDDDKYFVEGFKYAKDIKCCKYIYEYFMKLPTKVKITKTDLPKTEYDEILKEEQKSPVLLFLEELTYLREEDGDKITFYASNDLYCLFKEFCNRNFINTSMTKIGFGMKLSFLRLNGIRRSVKKIEGKKKNGFVVQHNTLSQEIANA